MAQQTTLAGRPFSVTSGRSAPHHVLASERRQTASLFLLAHQPTRLYYAESSAESEPQKGEPLSLS